MLRTYLRPFAAVAALAALAAYATIMLRGPQGVNAWNEKQAEIQKLQEDNANLARDIKNKQDRIYKLKSDPGTQELELRRLGLLHRRDTRFTIPGQRTASTPAHSAEAAR